MCQKSVHILAHKFTSLYFGTRYSDDLKQELKVLLAAVIQIILMITRLHNIHPK